MITVIRNSIAVTGKKFKLNFPTLFVAEGRPDYPTAPPKFSYQAVVRDPEVIEALKEAAKATLEFKQVSAKETKRILESFFNDGNEVLVSEYVDKVATGNKIVPPEMEDAVYFRVISSTPMDISGVHPETKEKVTLMTAADGYVGEGEATNRHPYAPKWVEADVGINFCYVAKAGKLVAYGKSLKLYPKELAESVNLTQILEDMGE
jgi:hypothetical protein